MIITKLQPRHLKELEDNLRSEDRLELHVASGLALRDSLNMCLDVSTLAYVAEDPSGNPVMAGGITVRDTLGIIWGVATPLINCHVRSIAALTRPILRDWFLMFPEVRLMYNQSLTSNTLHHRWLKWAGAELLNPVPRGPNGDLFTPFLIRRSSLCATQEAF